MKTKHIQIDPQMAAALGVKPVHGKISGDEANKCFQIPGKSLGESTNTESLRRDGNSEAYLLMIGLCWSGIGSAGCLIRTSTI